MPAPPVAPNSTEVGYLRPSASPDYDDPLENLFWSVIVGMTGLDGELVRPRWQVEAANMPDFGTNWAAFGVSLGARMWDAYQTHDPTIGSEGANVVEGSERIDVLFSFYGPNRQHYLSLLRDGMSVTQNRDEMSAAKVKFQEFSQPTNLPVLLKNTWVKRADLPGVFNRWVRRVYPIRTLESAEIGLNNERYITEVQVSPP